MPYEITQCYLPPGRGNFPATRSRLYTDDDISFPYSSLRRQQFDQEKFSAQDTIKGYLLVVCIVLLYFISPFQCICGELYILCYIVFVCVFMSWFAFARPK